MKKTTAALLGVAGTAAAIATVPYLHRQNTDLEASHYIFRSHKIGGALEGFRITQISDLHNRKFGTGNLRLLALTEAQLPDLLVITGDLTDSYRPNLQQALDTAARLAKIAPCYFVTGNHELRMEQQELEGTELLARAICHELDHLSGKLYVDLVEGELKDVEELEEAEDEA